MELYMYTGKMIDELLECVQRAEQHAGVECQITLKKTVLHSAGYSTHIYESVQSEQRAVA
jgi:hypothetical protein